jgi:hypothetical protein
MIVYCGLRHFYIRHFNPPQDDAYYILTHNKEIWDFSPELKEHGFTSQAKTTLYLDKPVLTLPITLDDFTVHARDWHKFGQHYTEELEVEYPHAWYLRFSKPAIFEQFIADFSEKLQQEKSGGIWGAGQSKLVAKLAAHNRSGHGRIVTPGQTKDFLRQIPLHRFPLAETDALEKLGIKTIGELERIPLVELSIQFGQRLAALFETLGRGEDLVPFRPRQAQEYSWTLDCTTLDSFLRPLSPSELKPYLQQGAKKLSASLKDQHKVAGQIKLGAHLDKGTYFEKTRQLKEATDDPEILKRIGESLLPKEYIAEIEIVASKLTASSLAQLTMFWEPQVPKVMDEELANYTQIGIELPRRERLLMLWEECFSEQTH